MDIGLAEALVAGHRLGRAARVAFFVLLRVLAVGPRIAAALPQSLQKPQWAAATERSEGDQLRDSDIRVWRLIVACYAS